jgi:hypothetical protein
LTARRKPVAGGAEGFFLSFRVKSVFNLWPFEPAILFARRASGHF